MPSGWTDILRDPGRIRQLLGDAPVTVQEQPAEPEWERIADEIIAARRAEPESEAEPDPALAGLDPIVFGRLPRVRECWPW